MCKTAKNRERNCKILELLDMVIEAMYNEGTVSLFPQEEIEDSYYGYHN